MFAESDPAVETVDLELEEIAWDPYFESDPQYHLDGIRDSLKRAAELLAGRVDFPLFVQGEQPRSILLERFRRSGNGVLLGSASFWEGVDVPGHALALVAIDRIPFAVPTDPIVAARSAALLGFPREGGWGVGAGCFVSCDGAGVTLFPSTTLRIVR